MVEHTNKARAEMAVSPLSRNSLLDIIASERADDMLQNQYFAIFHHQRGGARCGAENRYHYKHLAENIAMGHFQNDER